MNQIQICDKNFNEHSRNILNAIAVKNISKLKSLVAGNEYPEDFFDSVFLFACQDGDLEIIKYMITSQEFTPNPFSAMGVEILFKEKHEEVILWLIFEHEIKKSVVIEEILREIYDKEYAKYIESLFEKRELKKSLEKGIINTKKIENKSKL